MSGRGFSSETGEHTLVSLSAMCVDLLERNIALRGLILSMALGVERDEMNEVERDLLDEVLERST